MAEVIKHYQDIQENEELPSFELQITRTHIVRYAGAGGDMNPIHHDEEFARSIGLPSVFAMGLLHGGILPRIVTDWAGAGTIKRYKIRFESLVWPNDTLTFQGQVTKQYQEYNENLIDCKLSVVNQKGEITISGETTVSLP